MMSVVFYSAKLFQSQMAKKKIISVILFVHYSVFYGLLVILFYMGYIVPISYISYHELM